MFCRRNFSQPYSDPLNPFQPRKILFYGNCPWPSCFSWLKLCFKCMWSYIELNLFMYHDIVLLYLKLVFLSGCYSLGGVQLSQRLRTSLSHSIVHFTAYYKLVQRFALQVGWGTVAELKVTQANIISHNTIHHCSLEFNYEQVVVINSSTNPSTYLQISVHESITQSTILVGWQWCPLKWWVL